MAFCVLVLGDRDFRDYARLRDALDAALVNRLPHVEIITAGGPGAAALAASYAAARGLPVLAITADFVRFHHQAIERQNAKLVELADAVIAFGEAFSRDTDELLARLRAKGVRVVIVGTARAGKPPPEPPAEKPRYGMLPD